MRWSYLDVSLGCWAVLSELSAVAVFQLLRVPTSCLSRRVYSRLLLSRSSNTMPYIIYTHSNEERAV